MFSRQPRVNRSTESPMDFEFTDRPTTHRAPAWSETNGDPSTPRKRTVNDMNPPPSPFDAPQAPSYSRIGNVPFIFNTPPPQSLHQPPWIPPTSSPIKAPRFPEPELHDVDMSEPSPPPPRAAVAEKPNGKAKAHAQDEEDEDREGRAIATGGLRRVFKSRQKARERSRLAVVVRRGKSRGRFSDDEESGGEDEDGEDEDEEYEAVVRNTSNHYTLNVPAPAPPKSDTPYVLLGYLQVFFNLSLILVCLYLLVLFIITVQRDVEHRVAEYSMDIVQDIAACAMHYKANLCETNPIPAMMHQCGIWRTCMDRDPSKIGRAKVVAEMIAEVVNGFVEPISWKTLLFTLTSLAFLTAFINTLPSFFRPKPVPPHHLHHQPSLPAAAAHFPIQAAPLHHAQSLSWTPAEVEESFLAGFEDITSRNRTDALLRLYGVRSEDALETRGTRMAGVAQLKTGMDLGGTSVLWSFNVHGDRRLKGRPIKTSLVATCPQSRFRSIHARAHAHATQSTTRP
ncbi:hypothetical protein EIP91_005998 [Steccherinum ochraceum]|uniref:Brl1/Brr6 domain-containing protein n=1 Tax=Steccherinum ochraceum TaxID=92696 RepID=A0A4R0RLA8_9APHY|nr:hypothetical protein EIP91_005998 [Steccherinum ochraceum]